MQKALTPLHREQTAKPGSMLRGFPKVSLSPFPTPDPPPSFPFHFISQNPAPALGALHLPENVTPTPGNFSWTKNRPLFICLFCLCSSFPLSRLRQDLDTVPPGSPAAASLGYYFRKESADRRGALQSLPPRQKRTNPGTHLWSRQRARGSTEHPRLRLCRHGPLLV